MSSLSAAAPADPESLATWLRTHTRIFVLTGAGCSTRSGIPDYRDATGAWKRSAPVTWQAFTADPAIYRRYWARSFAGWPSFGRAAPNAAHVAVTRLQASGGVSAIVTQNVDGLHQRAGSVDVIDLHGRLDGVHCIDCGATRARASLQPMMAARNPGWSPTSSAAPDGDADIADAAVAAFEAPRCAQCDGRLKPDVVFFGENVPRARYLAAVDALQSSDAMLVLGSSLMVYSGFRFARMAHEAGLPLAIVNRGVTRADDLATLRVDGEVGAALEAALDA